MDSHHSPIVHQPIALVALDLDGTLMGGDLQISPRIHHVVKAVQQQGVITTLATGRMFSAALPFALELGISAPLICYQGGWIQAPGGDVLHRTILSQELAKSAIVLAKIHNWHAVLYAEGAITIGKTRYSPTFYERLLGPNAAINPDLEAVLKVNAADKVLFVAEPEEIPTIAKILVPHFAGKADVVQSHRMLIEVVPRDVNKGRALAWSAEHYRIPQQAVLAIGDQENDISMLSWAGLGVAMGNAVPSAQQAADWLAPTLENDGAAVALDRFVLHRGAL